MKARLAALALLLFPLVAHAATERILIPVFYNGGGVGAEWRSLVVVANLTGQRIETPGINWIVPCPIPEGCFLDSIASEQVAGLAGPEAGHGLVLTVPQSDERGDVITHLRIGAAPRNLGTGGTEIPIVPESRFTSRRIVLPNIVFGAGRRTLLRVYALDGETAKARIDLSYWYDPRAGNPVTTTELTLVRPLDSKVPNRFPAYADYDLSGLAGDGFGLMHLHITPLDGAKLWGFVTITDSATNEVTAIAPQ